MVTLKQLRYFDAVADCLHFGRAAERCAVSQPALSMQIKELEDQLQLALLERHPHGAALTAEGEEVARRARDVLRAVSDLTDYARHHRGLLTGALRLGVIPTVAPYLLPRILPAAQVRHPALELSIRETVTSALLRDIVETRLDVALVALPADEADLEHMALFDDRFLVAMARANPLSAWPEVPQRLLVHEKLLLLEEGHCLRDQALALCGSRGARRQMQEFGASSLATVVQMVASGYGVTLLPEMAVPIEVRDMDSVEVRPLAPASPSRTIGLVWRRRSPRAADYRELGRLITEVAGNPAPS